mgnify:CR=1 FL=1
MQKKIIRDFKHWFSTYGCFFHSSYTLSKGSCVYSRQHTLFVWLRCVFYGVLRLLSMARYSIVKCYLAVSINEHKCSINKLLFPIDSSRLGCVKENIAPWLCRSASFVRASKAVNSVTFIPALHKS